MDHTFTFTTLTMDYPTIRGVLIGEPGRPIVQCPHPKPTMQDIIDSVRNTVDDEGNPIYQAVAVPVAKIPHDIQAILEEGGALDWVKRSIDQVVFCHNILDTTSYPGLPPIINAYSNGLSGYENMMGALGDLQQIPMPAFNGKRTAIVIVPPGIPEPWRISDPQQAANSSPSFTARQLAQVAGMLVHETQHLDDAFHMLSNVPHDNPRRTQRFYDRILAPQHFLEALNAETRAFKKGGVFAREINARNAPTFHELPNTSETWNAIKSELRSLHIIEKTKIKHMRSDANPLVRLNRRAIRTATRPFYQTKNGIKRLKTLMHTHRTHDPTAAIPDHFDVFKELRNGSRDPSRQTNFVKEISRLQKLGLVRPAPARTQPNPPARSIGQ
ncbi:MAG TPA: hypothetical protein PKB15_05235 [Acidimicrobiia bacterium]|nr:hypothetical protein [Acidimicrobiia bacterium]